MFTSVTIKNFRGFNDLTVEPLGRVNLVAGKNNVGKTSLLEALFLSLAANRPESAYQLNARRGLAYGSLDANEMWGWLFHRKKVTQSIEVSVRDEANRQFSVCVRLAEHGAGSLKTLGRQGSSSAGPEDLSTTIVKRDLVLDYIAAGGGRNTCKAYIEGKELRFEGASEEPLAPAFFSSPRYLDMAQVAGQFSILDAKNRIAEALNVFRVVEPNLKRLSVLLIGGSVTIQGDIGLEEQIPLPLMGDGLVRLVSLVLPILDLPRGGIVLIDEIENGIHHSVMMAVWLGMAAAARQADVQVFATTHSYECVQAAHEAFTKSGPYDLRVHRLQREKDEVRAVTYDQETSNTTLELGWELR